MNKIAKFKLASKLFLEKAPSDKEIRFYYREDMQSDGSLEMQDFICSNMKPEISEVVQGLAVLDCIDILVASMEEVESIIKSGKKVRNL